MRVDRIVYRRAHYRRDMVREELEVTGLLDPGDDPDRVLVELEAWVARQLDDEARRDVQAAGHNAATEGS